MLNHIVLIGINYRHLRSSGDKNFWIDLIEVISSDIKYVTVISVRHNIVDYEAFYVNDCKIVIHYVAPKFIKSSDSSTVTKKIAFKAGYFPRALGVLEKFVDARAILDLLGGIHRSNPYDHIHLLDNFGFSNLIIASCARSSVSVSAMAYLGSRSLYLYDTYLKICYNHHNLSIIPYSEAYANKLIEIGVRPRNIYQNHWGVKCSSNSLLCSDIESYPADRNVTILWTGYIQQINKDDFLYALRIAKQAIMQNIKAKFVFAFKPESFEQDFNKYNDPSSGIIVKRTSIDEFAALKREAAVLFSPVVMRPTIVAPPLSWLEMLSNGVPIVTTNVSGVSEVISDGVNGFAALTDEELVSGLIKSVDNYACMAKSCQEVVQGKYSLYDSASRFEEIWRVCAKQWRSKANVNKIQGQRRLP